MDSTGAPPVPAELGATGNMYVITPHGGDFAQPVEVSIPAPTVTLLPTQQLKLAKARAQWRMGNSHRLDGRRRQAEIEREQLFVLHGRRYHLPAARLPGSAIRIDRHHELW